jgi:hypothetical protein
MTQDPRPPISPGDFSADLRRGVQGLRIGVPREWFSEGSGTTGGHAAFDAAIACRVAGSKVT